MQCLQDGDKIYVSNEEPQTYKFYGTIQYILLLFKGTQHSMLIFLKQTNTATLGIISVFPSSPCPGSCLAGSTKPHKSLVPSPGSFLWSPASATHSSKPYQSLTPGRPHTYSIGKVSKCKASCGICQALCIILFKQSYPFHIMDICICRMSFLTRLLRLPRVHAWLDKPMFLPQLLRFTWRSCSNQISQRYHNPARTLTWRDMLPFSVSLFDFVFIWGSGRLCIKGSY